THSMRTSAGNRFALPPRQLQEPPTGLEPVTSPLPRVCSTTELRWPSRINRLTGPMQQYQPRHRHSHLPSRAPDTKTAPNGTEESKSVAVSYPLASPESRRGQNRSAPAFCPPRTSSKNSRDPNVR